MSILKDRWLYEWGMDIARPGSDMSAYAISTIVGEGNRRIHTITTDINRNIQDLQSILLRKIAILYFRPKGYSHSHWRKIVKSGMFKF